FSEDAAGFEALDRTVTHCHAAMVLLTPGSRDQLQPRAPQVASVLEVLRARTGAVAALLLGVARGELPAVWSFDAVFEAALPPAGGKLAPVSVGEAQQWLAHRMPPFGTRTIGVPVAVLAMQRAELDALENDSALVARLGPEVAAQYTKV